MRTRDGQGPVRDAASSGTEDFGGRSGRWDDRAWNHSWHTAQDMTAGNVIESTPLVWGRRVCIGCRNGYLYCLGGR